MSEWAEKSRNHEVGTPGAGPVLPDLDGTVDSRPVREHPIEPPHQDPTTEHVRAACLGVTSSIGWLVERFSPVLHARALQHLQRLAGGMDAVDDILQEVWAIALLKLPKLESRDGRMTPVLVRFLVTTMTNLVLNWMRARAAATKRSRPIDDPQTLESLADATRTAIRSAVVREHVDMLMQALANLPSDEREIVLMHGIDGLDYGACSTRLSASAGALRMRHHRAMARLRAALPLALLDGFDPE